MLTQALLFLANSLAGFFSALLLLRFYLQLFCVSFHNPLGRFVVQLTNGIVMPLRRLLPGVFGLDLASLLPAWLLQFLFLLFALALHSGVGPLADGPVVAFLLWQAVLATLRLSLYLLIGALILQAILSWVAPYSPLAAPLAQVTGPVLAPIRRLVPPIAGIDLSPLIALLLVQLLLIFL